jgi:serine/threonine-protein kinase
MATVWRATDTLLGRAVAIKRLSPHLISDSAASERFRREAKAAARLKHPGIVVVHDAGSDEDGPWMAMELIEGEALSERVASAPLDSSLVVSIAEQTAAALDHAHSQGVVHRDVKPANIIIEAGGRVRLTDFGIAKPIDDPATITSTGEMVGTVSYMAPELLAGESATPASDIYSLAAVVFELLTGTKPFVAETTPSLVEAIRSSDPPDLRGKVSPQIEAALLRALDKDPRRRPATAGEFSRELALNTTLILSPVEEVPISPPPPVEAGSDDPTVVITREGGPGGRSPGGRRWRSGPAIAGAGAVVVLTIALLLGPAGADPDARESDPADTPTTTIPPFTTGLETTTTTVAGPLDIAAEIEDRLAGLGPPRYRQKDLREIEERVEGAVEAWQEDERERAADRLEAAFAKVGDLPDSDQTDGLFELLVELAEAMGFRVEGA